MKVGDVEAWPIERLDAVRISVGRVSAIKQRAPLGGDQRCGAGALLSDSEQRGAEEYCKGLSDKEVARNLCKSFWTIKTQKRSIYRKLGISKDIELIWWMVCNRLGIPFDLKEIRRQGITLIDNN